MPLRSDGTHAINAVRPAEVLKRSWLEARMVMKEGREQEGGTAPR